MSADLAATTAIEPATVIYDLLRWVEPGDLTVESGDTHTVSGTETYSDAEVAGTLSVGGTLQLAGTDSAWTLESPTVMQWWERAQAERGPGADQPAEIYTWQPTRTSRTRFSADGDLMVEEPTVEAWVYTLDESDTATYARDIITIMEEYMDNQYQETDYGDITPTGIEDFRESKMRRKTDYFIYAVEIEMERLDPTGL